MNAPDHKRAANEAKRLLDKYAIKYPPIDPENIAEDEGLQVVYAEFEPPFDEEASGFLAPDERKIYVNKTIVSRRITFTIAHELAHHLLHTEYVTSDMYVPMPRKNDDVETKSAEEVEADTFAANLLVPLNFLKDYQDVATVSELARLFFVREELVRNRLDLLMRHPHLART